MENSEKAKWIIDVVRRSAAAANCTHINAVGDLAKEQTMHDLWEKENKGFLDSNPRNITFAAKRVNQTLVEKLARDKVLAYAIDVFLDKIPQTDEED